MSIYLKLICIIFKKEKSSHTKEDGKHLISLTWEKEKNANELFPARTRALVPPGVLRCARHFPCTQRFLQAGPPWHCLPRENSKSGMGDLWGHERHCCYPMVS